MKRTWIGVLGAVGMLALGACSKDDAGQSVAPSGTGLDKIVIAGMPPQAPQGVKAARAEAKTGDTVFVEGKVKDFVEGAAAFTIADGSIPPCNEIPGDKCPTPWDFCCEPPENLVKGCATVKVVDAGNQPLLASIKGVKKLDHLTTVVAEGKAVRDDQGNLTVEATKIYLPAAK